jgi:peptidoglycan/xylan/chitin deacetylase (PgdA/CDA1 family)
MKEVTVFFDFEEIAHKPFGEFDLEENMRGILSILAKHKAKAVFNTCGIIAEKNPEILKEIHGKGHEIASHGYMHENFAQLEPEELDEVLAKTERLIYDTIKEKPVGVRSPWLISNEQIYDVFEQRGYKWVSNKYLEFPELRMRPDYPKSKRSISPRSQIKGLISERKRKKRWEKYRQEPYRLKSAFEIPILSSLEGDLLFYLSPTQKSPELWLDYAYNSLVSQYKRCEKYFNLNFHPWLIGSANRLTLLDRILDYVTKQGAVFVLAKDLVTENEGSQLEDFCKNLPK